MRGTWIGATVCLIALIGLLALLPGFTSSDFKNAPLVARPIAVHRADPPREVVRTADVRSDAPRPRFPDRRVRLELWSVAIDVYAIALFLLLGATSIQWHRSKAQSQEFPAVALAMSVLGVAGVMWCIHQVAFGWRFIAPRYWIAAVAMVAILVLSASATHSNWLEMCRQALRGTQRTFAAPATWIAIMILPVALLLSQLTSPRTRTDPSIPTGAAFIPWFAAQARATELSSTAENGVVTVLTFTDYQGPACNSATELYGPLISRLTQSTRGAVRFKDMDYPLERGCNSLMRSDVHPSACEAAVAVRLARDHGKDQAMKAWLSRNHSRLTPDGVKQAAHDVGGVPDYEAKYQQTLKLVMDDVALGNRVGVVGTPTFFVNGKQLRLVPPSDFEAAIRSELGSKAR